MVEVKDSDALIVTARIPPPNLAFFDGLRRAHFPPERNFLKAHLTLFHKLPGSHLGEITDILCKRSNLARQIDVDVVGVIHLGGGVAFELNSPLLRDFRASLRDDLHQWLGNQDLQGWRPHVTVQNKVPKVQADTLFKELAHSTFPLEPFQISGVDLWIYRGGPWDFEKCFEFLG